MEDPDFDPPGDYRPAPGPRQGLMPCPDCNPDGWDAMWPPQPPPVRTSPPLEQVVAQTPNWVDVDVRTALGG